MIFGKYRSGKFISLFIEIGLRQIKMFWKAQEVIYNFDVQPKIQSLELHGENPIARLKVAIVLMLSSLISILYFANILSYKSPIEVLLCGVGKLT